MADHEQLLICFVQQHAWGSPRDISDRRHWINEPEDATGHVESENTLHHERRRSEQIKCTEMWKKKVFMEATLGRKVTTRINHNRTEHVGK